MPARSSRRVPDEQSDALRRQEIQMRGPESFEPLLKLAIVYRPAPEEDRSYTCQLSLQLAARLVVLFEDLRERIVVAESRTRGEGSTVVGRAALYQRLDRSQQ